MTEQLKQGSQEWLDARVGKITGSRAGAILGLSPFATHDDVMRDMVREYFGAEREFKGNVATDYGNEHEPIARQDYEIETGNEGEEVGFICGKDEFDWLGVSPDDLIGDDGGVEIKCPYSKKIQTLEDKPDYFAQTCLSLIVTGRKWWDFYCWTPDQTHIEQVTFGRALVWFKDNEPELRAFHDEYLAIIQDESLYQKYLDPLEVDLSDDDSFTECANLYLEAKKNAVEAKKLETKAKTALEKFAKDTSAKRIRGNGITISKATRQGSINYKAIPELQTVDLDKYRGEPTEYIVIK